MLYYLIVHFINIIQKGLSLYIYSIWIIFIRSIAIIYFIDGKISFVKITIAESLFSILNFVFLVWLLYIKTFTFLSLYYFTHRVWLNNIFLVIIFRNDVINYFFIIWWFLFFIFILKIMILLLYLFWSKISKSKIGYITLLFW